MFQVAQTSFQHCRTCGATEWSKEYGFEECEGGNKEDRQRKNAGQVCQGIMVYWGSGEEGGVIEVVDSVIDLGHVRGLQNLNRMLSALGRGNRPCLLCDVELGGLLS